MKPVLDRLHENGIGSILDYAAEVRAAANCSQGSGSTCDPGDVNPRHAYQEEGFGNFYARVWKDLSSEGGCGGLEGA